MSFPIETVREQFPSLHHTNNGAPRNYLDNPAGTQVPQRVIDAISNYFLHSNANLGGYFTTTKASLEVLEDAHKAMADFLGTDDTGEVIIGASMTMLTLHISRSICRDFEPGGEIILTTMDHEGNVSPWVEIAKDRGFKVKYAKFNEQTWKVEPETIKALITEKTKLVAINYASNLTGSINDIKEITKVAKSVGAIVYVDAVQQAPHRRIDVKDLGCDFLVCSSYKFFGPHLGILWGKRELLEKLHAYKCICASNELPDKFEIGTPQLELLAGLTAAVDYIASLGDTGNKSASRAEKITQSFALSKAYEDDLASILIEGLQQIDGIKIYGLTDINDMESRVPTISITHHTKSPGEMAEYLAKKEIYVWNGHNYAYGIVNQLGLENGVLRIGIAHYNTKQEIEALLTKLTQCVK